jgi:hypothetical protein
MSHGRRKVIVQSFLGGRPGQRIDDYRNSEPRYVKVLGVGTRARQVIDRFNDAHKANVLTSGELNPDGLQAMDEPINGIRPNAVIVIYEQGDDTRFPFLTDRTASMLSFVVLETGAQGTAAVNKKVREIRAVADLYVTTSDTDFVAELVDNLAS